MCCYLKRAPFHGLSALSCGQHVKTKSKLHSVGVWSEGRCVSCAQSLRMKEKWIFDISDPVPVQMEQVRGRKPLLPSCVCDETLGLTAQLL